MTRFTLEIRLHETKKRRYVIEAESEEKMLEKLLSRLAPGDRDALEIDNIAREPLHPQQVLEDDIYGEFLHE